MNPSSRAYSKIAKKTFREDSGTDVTVCAVLSQDAVPDLPRAHSPQLRVLK